MPKKKQPTPKEKIEKLLSFGIGFSTDKFKPDENIKQKDFMALLVAAFSNQKLNSETDCEQIYKIAKQNGYIKDDEISFNSDVSRISAAKFVIRAMGYAPVAKLENIFKTKFSDVQTDVGYAAILGEMNIINGDENNLFNPNNNLTRADGAIIIYNCLNR